MQIELVGCTGAGKSTLAARIAEAAHNEGIDLAIADDFVLSQLGLRCLKKRWLRAVFVHLAAFSGCMSRCWRHFRFIGFSHRVLRNSGISRLQQWNQLRKVLKQLGRYELIRCSQQSQTPVLVDEGTLHAAHNLFVHADYEFNEDQVREFADHVPLPDLVIYVREREDVLVERTLHRGHPRISDATHQSVSKFVHQAVLAFDQLSRHERIAQRMIVIQDGRIVSESVGLFNPQMKRLFDFVFENIQPGCESIGNPACAFTQAAHCGAEE